MSASSLFFDAIFVETRSSCHIVCLSSDPPTARPKDKPTTKMAEYVHIIRVDDDV